MLTVSVEIWIQVFIFTIFVFIKTPIESIRLNGIGSVHVNKRFNPVDNKTITTAILSASIYY